MLLPYAKGGGVLFFAVSSNARFLYHTVVRHLCDGWENLDWLERIDALCQSLRKLGGSIILMQTTIANCLGSVLRLPFLELLADVE